MVCAVDAAPSVAPSAVPSATPANTPSAAPSAAPNSMPAAPAHKLRLRVCYGLCRRCRRQVRRRYAICGTVHQAVCCAVCVSEQRAVSGLISYTFECTMVWAGDAAVRCAERSAICDTIQCAVSSAVCVFEQHVVSRPSSDAFECSVVCAVCVSNQRNVSLPKHQQHLRVYYGLCRRCRRQLRRALSRLRHYSLSRLPRRLQL